MSGDVWFPSRALALLDTPSLIPFLTTVLQHQGGHINQKLFVSPGARSVPEQNPNVLSPCDL